jgi:hypothetical protein
MFNRFAAFAARHASTLLFIFTGWTLAAADIAARAGDAVGVLVTIPWMMALGVGLLAYTAAYARITVTQVEGDSEPDIVDQIDALIRDHDARNVLIRASDLGALRVYARESRAVLIDNGATFRSDEPVYRLDGSIVAPGLVNSNLKGYAVACSYTWGDLCVLVERDEVRS